MVKEKIQEGPIIPELTWEAYLRMFRRFREEPGTRIPFDKPGARLAQEYGITVILLGKNFKNTQKRLAGKEFEGTIVHP